MTELCNDFATAEYHYGAARFVNNTWGKDKLRDGESYRQCLQVDDARGWTWQWPDRVDPSVYAYPEILTGSKPFGDEPTAGLLPQRIADLTECSVDYNVETVAGGSWNLALDLWVCKDVKPTQKNIATEVMFWLDWQNCEPAGNAGETVTLGGIDWTVYTDDLEGWRLITFLAWDKQPKSFRVPVLEGLKYLVKGAEVDPQHYLACVEFGNEVCGGSGLTVVHDYMVNVQASQTLVLPDDASAREHMAMQEGIPPHHHSPVTCPGMDSVDPDMRRIDPAAVPIMQNPNDNLPR